MVISGNTFRNGGRGSWINQPRNFVLADNIFVNNTTTRIAAQIAMRVELTMLIYPAR